MIVAGFGYITRLTARPGSRIVLHTRFPKRSDPFYLVNFYVKWVTTSWTDGITIEDVIQCISLSN